MRLKQLFNDFRNDRRAILLEGLLAVAFIGASSIIGVIGALMINRIADAVQPFIADNVDALGVVESARNTYIIGVVLTDIALLVYWGVSAQRKERQSSPAIYVGG